MKYSIGVDIGGMSVKVGLVNQLGEIVSKDRFVTSFDYKKTVLDLKNTIENILIANKICENDILGIGMGCPGAIDAVNGIVEFWDNMAWHDVHLVEELSKYFKVNIKLANDANVAILGEVKFGCARDAHSAVMLTLGTGVGGGVVIDDKLFAGKEDKGTELGHMVIVHNGIKCNCGMRGCLEKYASATALMDQTKKAMLKDRQSLMWTMVDGDIEKVDGRVPFECSKKGDKTAIKVVDKFVSYLGDGVLSLLNIFRPDAIIIGGGVSAAGDYLRDRLIKYCAKYNYGMKGTPVPQFFIASLGNDAGIIGASCLVL